MRGGQGLVTGRNASWTKQMHALDGRWIKRLRDPEALEHSASKSWVTTSFNWISSRIPENKGQKNNPKTKPRATHCNFPLQTVYTKNFVKNP